MFTLQIIDACQTILSQAYFFKGLESSLLCQIDGYQSPIENSVQIHYDADRNHWLTSSTMRNRIEIADSLFQGKLSTAVSRQLCHIYRHHAKDNTIEVFMLPTQIQNNAIDCGCHAIATAVELLVENGDPTADFDFFEKNCVIT